MERRFAFLWALLVSISIAIFYFGSRLVWGTLPNNREFYVLTLTSAAACYFFLANQAVARLWNETHPSQVPSASSLTSMILFLRGLEEYGDRKARLANLPRASAAMLLVVGLALHGVAHADALWPIDIVLAGYFGYAVLLEIGGLVITKRFLAGSAAVTALGVFSVSPGWPDLKSSVPELVGELRQKAQVLGKKQSLRASQTAAKRVVGRPNRIDRIMVAAAFVVLLVSWKLWWATQTYSPQMISALVELLMVTILAFVAAHLIVRLYLDPSRLLLEQVRFMRQREDIDDDAVALMIETIELFRDSPALLSSDVIEVRHRLSLPELQNIRRRVKAQSRKL